MAGNTKSSGSGRSDLRPINTAPETYSMNGSIQVLSKRNNGAQRLMVEKMMGNVSFGKSARIMID